MFCWYLFAFVPVRLNGQKLAKQAYSSAAPSCYASCANQCLASALHLAHTHESNINLLILSFPEND